MLECVNLKRKNSVNVFSNILDRGASSVVQITDTFHCIVDVPNVC